MMKRLNELPSVWIGVRGGGTNFWWWRAWRAGRHSTRWRRCRASPRPRGASRGSTPRCSPAPCGSPTPCCEPAENHTHPLASYFLAYLQNNPDSSPRWKNIFSLAKNHVQSTNWNHANVTIRPALGVICPLWDCLLLCPQQEQKCPTFTKKPLYLLFTYQH